MAYFNAGLIVRHHVLTCRSQLAWIMFRDDDIIHQAASSNDVVGICSDCGGEGGGVEAPKNRAVTRLGSWDSGQKSHPQAVSRLVGELRIDGETRKYGLYTTYTPESGRFLSPMTCALLASRVRRCAPTARFRLRSGQAPAPGSRRVKRSRRPCRRPPRAGVGIQHGTSPTGRR